MGGKGTEGGDEWVVKEGRVYTVLHSRQLGVAEGRG